MRPLRRAAYHPLTIPGRLRGVALDLDPNRLTGISDGGAMATATDYAGSARDFSQATGTKQPAWTQDGRNGRAVMRFDGGDELAGNTAAKDLFRNIGSATIILVLQTTAPGTQHTPFFATTNGAGVRVGFHRDQGGTAGLLQVVGRRLDADGAAFAQSSNKVSAGTWTIDAATFDWANSDLYLYQNGAQLFVNNTFQTAGSTSDTASANFFIGSANNTAFINGDIARVLVYVPALTLGTLIRVSRSLGRTYAITTV